MIRKLVLALAILLVAAVPAQARGGGHGSHGHHGHHGHSHHFGGFYAPYPYGYVNCWQEGHWVNQLYVDKYGNSTNVAQWVPGQWGCWY
jgi:hypothetical protein